MSDAHLGLQRYEGRYLTDWGWYDGKDISRYLNVKVTGDHHARRSAVQFTKRLREPIKRGEITCSVRIWMKPKVKVGGRYKLEEGYVIVDKLVPIGFDDITPALARRSGFLGVVDLLKTAKHGRGENVYLVEFHYEE